MTKLPQLPFKIEINGESIEVNRKFTDTVELVFESEIDNALWRIPVNDKLWDKFVEAIREPEGKCVHPIPIGCEENIEGMCQLTEIPKQCQDLAKEDKELEIK